MDEQEEGWPLGLRPLNGRIGLVRPLNQAAHHADPDGSVSFTTLFSTASPTTSDLDTQCSSRSLFHERSITLGSLMGIHLLNLSRRSSTRRFTTDTTIRDSTIRNSKPNSSNYKPPCFFSLCSNLTTDAVVHNANIPSLAHFLRAERKPTLYRTATPHRQLVLN